MALSRSEEGAKRGYRGQSVLWFITVRSQVTLAAELSQGVEAK